MKISPTLSRREFVSSSSNAFAGALFLNHKAQSLLEDCTGPKRRLAMVGTGHRGTGMWEKSVVASDGDIVEFVGLCDIKPGRARLRN